MLEDDKQNGGNNSSESNSTPPPTPTRDTNDTQIRTENDSMQINK